MPSGNQPPSITEHAVRKTLENLLYASATPPRETSLRLLALVDEALTDPDFPRTEYAAEIVLANLLTSLIVEKLSECQRSAGLPHFTPTAPLEMILDQIREASQNNIEMAAWGLLYYRFVRIDLKFNWKSIENLLGIDERTLRRYMTHGIRRVTENLVMLEWDARSRQRKHRLRSALPSEVNTQQLIGRDKILSRIINLLQGENPTVIYITGIEGIGKSAVAACALHRLIEVEILDHIIWVNDPESSTFVIQTLTQLLPDGASFRLQEYFTLNRVVIVLDGVEKLLPTALEQLLELVDKAYIILTSRVYFRLGRVQHHFALSELSEENSFALAKRVSENVVHENDYKPTQDDLHAIWEQTGGNPQAIILVAADMSFGLLNAGSSAAHIYGNMYRDLSSDARYGWCLLALLPAATISLLEMIGLKTDTLVLLQRLHFLERQQDSLTLSNSARFYIQTQHSKHWEIRDLLHAALHHLDSLKKEQAHNLLDVFEGLLLTTWAQIPDDYVLSWIELFYETGLSRGHHAVWCSIFERYFDKITTSSFTLWTAYAKCLRRVFAWDKSQIELEQIIAICGQKGLFKQQANALLELAILHRYRGKYQEAQAVLRRVSNNLFGDSDFSRRVIAERAQIAVDVRDADSAKQFLSKLDEESAKTLLLKGEIYFLLHEYKACLECAERVKARDQKDSLAAAHVYTLIARCYLAVGLIDEAHNHFVNALITFEKTDDVYGIGRAALNLSVVLIQQEAYDEARKLLERAEHIQRSLGDRSALLVTQHNLQILQTRLLG